jgi:hypothetical protein
MAAQGGQDMLSPYRAMGNEPVRYIDPDGRKIKINGNVHDPILTRFLDAWLGRGNYSFDDDNNLILTPGSENDVTANLIKYFKENMYKGKEGESGSGGSEDANKAASEYARAVISRITGDSKNTLIDDGNGNYEVGNWGGELQTVSITAEKEPSAFGRWWNNLLSISFDGGYYFTANTWGENGERRVSHTAKKVNIEWLMPILDVYTPDLNMFDVQTPNFVNYMNGVTDYATGLNAGMDEWDNKDDPVRGVFYRNPGEPYDSIHYKNAHQSWLQAHDAVPDTFYNGQIDSSLWQLNK